MGLIFEPQRAQRARENGRKSSPMLRLRGKSSLGELCELGGNIFILRGELLFMTMPTFKRETIEDCFGARNTPRMTSLRGEVKLSGG
jgi:hypothetical protein